MFAGWNTASPRQYELLLDYVRRGGTLFISIPHLSTNDRRNYSSFGVEELVNGGDFSDLCGVRVEGPDERFYWATVPHDSTELGVRFPRRFGIMAVPSGRVQFVDPSVEALVVDDEHAKPILLRRRCGAGTVYFLNAWAYPGAMNTDEGPGARVGSKGLIGTLYQHIAAAHRGSVWITDDGQTTGVECEYIAYSYFPEDGSICVQNVDLHHSRRVFLHQDGKVRELQLDPGEFRLIRAQ